MTLDSSFNPIEDDQSQPNMTKMVAWTVIQITPGLYVRRGLLDLSALGSHYAKENLQKAFGDSSRQTKFFRSGGELALPVCWGL
jgi:hypothetical protein